MLRNSSPCEDAPNLAGGEENSARVTESSVINTGFEKEAKLPRQDWIMLPALSLLTVCFILGSAELIGWWMFPYLDGAGEECIVFNNPSIVARGIPNCACREKIPEGERTEYRFNNCGYRTNLQCGTKSPGAYRIVLIGGSSAMGMRVPNEKTFAVLLPSKLSQRTGRHVELYNEGMPWRPPHIIALHFQEVLAAKPDMILWILSDADVWNRLFTPPDPGLSQAVSGPSPYRNARQILAAALSLAKKSTRLHSIILLRHLLYESQSRLITKYLARKPDEPYAQRIHGPEFMRTKPSAEWQSRLKDFDNDVADMQAQAKAAGVPLVAVLLPERAQAAMISRGEWPAGFDPYKLDNELRSMMASHGVTYFDILPDFRNVPNSEQDFFPLDVHPNALGHAFIAELLARALTNGSVPALRVAAPRQAGLEQRK